MRSKEFVVIGLALLILSLVIAISEPERSIAANTILWTEVDPPATSGTFVSLVSGDINHDGRRDIIGGSLLGIGVAAGNGDGSWTPLSPVTASGQWYGLALGDVNGDGDLDVVGAEDSAGIRIWTGDGAGGWTPFASPAVAGSFWSVALGDVNGDGDLDIAAGSGGDGGLKVWTGDGAGVWTALSTGLPVTGNYADVAMGDVDRDSDLDLVAASHGKGVQAWRLAVSWTERSSGLPDSGDYYGVALADLDNDGDLDIVASGDGVGVGAWTRGGGAIWSWSPAATGLPVDGQYWDVGIGDVNNDGKQDLAASAYSLGVRVWTGNGGGSWSEESTGLPDTGAYYDLTLGDFDDDGMLDLSAGQNAGVQAWFDEGTPDVLGGWLQIASPTTSGSYQGLDVGDWDHDGKLDVVAASNGSGIQLWEGDGGNTWDEISDWTSSDLPSSGNYTGIAFGDINHSGWLDLVAGSGEDKGIRAWLFMDAVAWIEHSDGLPGSGTYLDVAMGDYNSDGRLDIVAVGQGTGVKAWIGDGGTLWLPTAAGLPPAGSFLSVALGDINRDGNLDLVAGSSGGGVGVWQGAGTGWSAQALPTNTGDWRGVALGDVNDDGELDIVAAEDGSGVAVWAGDGAFGWTAKTPPAAAGAYTHVALGDVNNDGKLDVAAGTSTGGLRVWTGDGGTTWTPFSLNLPVTGQYADVALSEIDNDGVLDLVGAKVGAGSVHAWTGAEGAPPSGWDNFAPTDWITQSQKADVSIQVHDTGSGLDVSSAGFAFLGDAGVWSSWTPASCTGSDGVTSTQTINAAGVTFNQDSGPWPHEQNLVRFRVSDMAGNAGYSGEQAVYIDTTPPTNPSSFTSSHWPGVWSNDTTVDVDWDGAADATSGMDYGRYSYLFDTFCDLPDMIVDTAASMATSDPLGDGEWYIGVRTRDTAGVWATDAVCDGPYRIDTGPPTNPTSYTSSHDVGVWSSDNTIYIDWSGADDAGSGVFGYSFAWLIHTGTPPETVVTSDSQATSDELADGDSWYFNIRTQDRAGNWTPAGETVHWGPFTIDTTAPTDCWVTAPPEVFPPSFVVQWSYLDAGSGVASYDVEVRDSASGSWTPWQTATTDTSASYTTAEAGHTYDFRVRARDQVSNVSGFDCQAQSLAIEDLTTTGLEVTQVVQNLANDVPLIADKDTYVRFYVQSSYVDVPDVDAALYGTRGGVPLPGSPLAPTGGPITVTLDGGDRATLGDAFYFRLPAGWKSGSVQLRAVVNPDHAIPENDTTNNERSETVTFETSGDFCVVFVPIHLRPDTYRTDDAGFWDIVALLKSMYPVREWGVGIYSDSTLYPDAHRSGWHYGLPQDYDRVLRDLNQHDFWTEDPCHETHWFGMVHPNSQPTGAMGMGRRPGDVAAGVMAISRGGAWPEPVGGRVLAHELGHNFGRRHVWCTGCEIDGGEVDRGYPYEEASPHVCGSATAYTCRIGPDSDTEYYGFWRDSGGTPEIIEPVGTGDLMSYFSSRWPSDWTYAALLGELREAADRVAQGEELAMSTSADWAEAAEFIFAAGIISPTAQTAELDPFYLTSEPDRKFVTRSYGQELATAASADVYSLVLEDAQGGVLYTHTFTGTAQTDDNMSPGDVIFGEVFPYTPAARVVLKHGETELAARDVSAHAPTVTLLSPNGGETITDHLTISWTGSDPDGDDVRYTVQYSADDGETWEAVALDWMDTTFETTPGDLSTYPGSDVARVRVIASDGVNTATDESDAVFSLARKAPQVHILEPGPGLRFEVGETILFRGVGMDAEDGPLGEAGAFTWTSHISGTLGTGAELWVSDLPAGKHHITMQVSDSDGQTSSDTVAIFVGPFQDRFYLPVLTLSY